MVENIQSICINTTYVCAAGVGVAVVAYGVARGMKFLSGGVKCLAAASLAGTLIIGGMVVTSVHVAGAKTNDTQQVGGDTNQIENEKWRMGNSGGRTTILHSPFSILHSASPITDDDIAQGWRVVSVSSNALAAATFTMPEGATVWEDARDFGAGWGSWKIPFGGWRFTYGNVGWTNGFAWIEGYVRSRFNSRANEIRLLSDRLALCPAANWARYNLAASRAWCVTNDVGGLVVTFENAAIADDPMKIASVQMELFPRTGEVALRYDLANVGDATYTAGLVVDGTNHFVEVGAETREVVFQRVHPADWDMDGLPNTIDGNPRVPSSISGWNQSDAWAMAAFPSNATEIAAMGYAAWATARAADPNRRLIALTLASKNNTWPVCLTFGNVQVMCDGAEQIVFPIDCGARYAFSVSGGELATVSVPGGMSRDVTWEEWYTPLEYSVGDVAVRQESARSGWLGITAEVRVDELESAHFFPDDSRTVTAVVTNCHEDAYIDCTWSGGEGVTFSNCHSLETVISWQTTNSVAWATNKVTLVTTYAGDYAITNGYVITVGPQAEPTTTFEVSCPAVQFLNDGIGGDRPERVYRIDVRLLAARGTSGTLRLVSTGGTMTGLFNDEGRLWPVGTDDTITMVIPFSGGFEDRETLYMTSSQIGAGTINAVLTLDDGGGEHESSVPFEVVEPIRKLVNVERYGPAQQFVNPSCLVMGADAVLKASVRTGGSVADGFTASNITWRIVSGAARPVETNVVGNADSYFRVAPTALGSNVVVEAKFNNDAIQPRIVLPVVEPRVLNVKAFVVDPPEGVGEPWEDDKIVRQIERANEIFTQVGITFVLQQPIQHHVSTSAHWRFPCSKEITCADGTRKTVCSDQLMALLDHYRTGNCIELYFVGEFTDQNYAGLYTSSGIAITQKAVDSTVAHELGHALGWEDCYSETEQGTPLEGGLVLLGANHFLPFKEDWGDETGRGFYEREDTLFRIHPCLLMYGIASTNRFDIPFSSIYGLKSLKIYQPGYVKVGAGFIKPTNQEIYTK